jgi:cystathionine gamma-lyase
MGAISAAILHFVKSGSRVVAHRNIYGSTRSFLTGSLARFGVRTVFVDAPDAASFARAMEGGVDLVFLESPSSFIFAMQDIEGISREAHARGAQVIVDNTWATPLHQRPLLLGANVSVHSASKYLGGHSDIVAGALACEASLAESIARGERDLLGSCMDPHQAWLLIRGLRTLPLRMERQGSAAREVVAFLERHALVERVLWPGCADHPGREIAARQLSGNSGLFSFVPRFGLAGVGAFLARLELLEVGPSWGGYESLAIAPGLIHEHAELDALAIPQNLIRVSVGLESASSIIEDLDRALVAGSQA